MCEGRGSNGAFTRSGEPLPVAVVRRACRFFCMHPGRSRNVCLRQKTCRAKTRKTPWNFFHGVFPHTRERFSTFRGTQDSAAESAPRLRRVHNAAQERPQLFSAYAGFALKSYRKAAETGFRTLHALPLRFARTFRAFQASRSPLPERRKTQSAPLALLSQ